MKRIFIFIMFILLTISLFSCVEDKSYDDLYQDYITHIDHQKSLYQSHIDYFNHVSSEIIKSVVLVEKKIMPSSVSSSGSGILIKEDDTHYYVLTNNHVVYVEDDKNYTYIISDYQGNTYDATLVVRDHNYDLAILKFSKGSLDLAIIGFAQSNPEVSDKLAILGHPNYQINSITLGYVIDYAPITIDTSSSDVINVLFPILISDAPVKSGSSGSMVIDDDFNLVGVIYAGNFVDANETSEYSFSIPIEKVYAFFDLHGFDLEEVES